MMKKGYSLLCRQVKTVAVVAGLFVIQQQAFALEINNNAQATLNVTITDCAAKPIKKKIAPGQVYGCTSGEQCSGTCGYSISASGNDDCDGAIDAGAGLQVNKGLDCIPY